MKNHLNHVHVLAPFDTDHILVPLTPTEQRDLKRRSRKLLARTRTSIRLSAKTLADKSAARCISCRNITLAKRRGRCHRPSALFLCIKEYLKAGERVESVAREETGEIGSRLSASDSERKSTFPCERSTAICTHKCEGVGEGP